MTRFTAHSGNYVIKLKLIVDRRRSAMAAKTISRLSAVNIAPSSVLHCWRQVQSVAYRPVQAIDSRVVADPAFLKSAIVTKDKRLSDACVTESIEDWLAERFFAVGH